MPGFRFFALTAVLTAGVAAPAHADPGPRTRLVECRDETCLLVTGRRDDAAAVVSINGRVVEVEGGRKWRMLLPVGTVREWSAPFARTITVSVAEASGEADLPTGLLGHVSDLTALVVTAK